MTSNYYYFDFLFSLGLRFSFPSSRSYTAVSLSPSLSRSLPVCRPCLHPPLSLSQPSLARRARVRLSLSLSSTLCSQRRAGAGLVKCASAPTDGESAMLPVRSNRRSPRGEPASVEPRPELRFIHSRFLHLTRGGRTRPAAGSAICTSVSCDTRDKWCARRCVAAHDAGPEGTERRFALSRATVRDKRRERRDRTKREKGTEKEKGRRRRRGG